MSNAIKVDIQPSSPGASLVMSSVNRVNISTYVIDTLSQEVEQIVSKLPRNHWFLFLGYMNKSKTHHDDAQIGSTGKPYIGQSTPIGAVRELSEETGHRLKPGEQLTYQGKGRFKGARLTYYSVAATQLNTGNFHSRINKSVGDDFSRRTMTIIHGTESEMKQFATNGAAELQKPGMNPDNIGYFYVMSWNATLDAIRQQPSGKWGGWMSV